MKTSECPNCKKEFSGYTKFCSKDCWNKSRTGENHPLWKGGGRRPTAEGYIRVLIYPDNPFYEMGRRHSPISKDVLEHRLVMAGILGRPLRKDESVHHLNGVKSDNRPENLELRSSNHGIGAAMCCAECGSKNLIPVTVG